MSEHGPLRWTVERAGREFGPNPKTIAKRLTTYGILADPSDGLFSTQQIASAIFGDIDHEKLRKVKGEADAIEMQNAETRKELIRVQDAATVAGRFTYAARQIIVLSKLSGQEKEALLGELRSLAETDWREMEGILNEEAQ